MDDFEWWQRGIVYQIYPRSFQDSNGDGIGDLPGIAGRLDYVASLRVDALWLSPIYPSPMDDFGYDVADYCDVDPIFGTLADFDRLIDAAHARGLKIILDYVPNHSSDRHPWFVESRASRENPKRDWYIWRDPGHDNGPPNNWLSEFGGGAWELDDATGQYYLHSYLKSQPDLNWRNPEVVDAMLDVLRFWLKRGVDGFRVDTVHHLIKDKLFRDNPLNPEFRPDMPPHHRLIRQYSIDQPEVHAAIAEMRRVLGEFGADRVLIAEVYLPIARMMPYYGASLSGAQLPFNFHLISSPWEPEFIARIIADYEAALPEGAWPNWVLGNHDKPRLATRLGPAQERIAAMLLLTLRGTPTLYYGDEIGMTNGTIPPELVHDPFEKNVPGLGLGRDPARTPMQWDGGAKAGFTNGTPWLPISADAGHLNVKSEMEDPASILLFYRRMIALRRQEPALSVGSISDVMAKGTALTYTRAHEGRRLWVALNFSARPDPISLPDEIGELLVATDPAISGATDKFVLPPNGGAIFVLGRN